MRYLAFVQALILLLFLLPVHGDEPQDLYKKGEYEKCLNTLKKEGGTVLLRIKVLKTLGRYDEALKEWIDAGIRSSDITGLYEGIELFRLNGREQDAEHLVTRLNFFVNNGYFSDPNELVTRGRTALMRGVDASVVLKEFYDEAIRRDPNFREAYLAAAELAFSKDDSATAASVLQKANKQFPKDPDILFGLSKAFEESEGKFSQAALKSTLEINPNHLPTLKHLLRKALLGDDLKKSSDLLEQILKVNKNQPQILAYKACYKLLLNDKNEAESLRKKALEKFTKNPLVDYTIGHFLAYKGKFKESNKYLESSLKISPGYQPALVDYALNLLRLGDTEKGFKLAAEISQKDPYNLTAFNLLQLFEVFKKMKVVENDHFKIRLNENDAELYGDHALEFLMQAREYYFKKYGYQSKEKVFVDFYNSAEDFAIRNFSYPLEFGALGICFGQVITMKTIEAQTNRVNNWRETLWHEYGHVVTLGMTNKNIPRWLTEGISVYEESLGPEGWGMKMTPEFSERLKEKDLYPVEHLNAGFHSEDIMFAYYQAGLMVKFLVDTKGFDHFKNMLNKMSGEEKPLTVLEQFYGKAEQIDDGFNKFSQSFLAKYSHDADFTEVEENFESVEQAEEFLKSNPRHIPALASYASLCLKEGKENEAEETLKKIISLYPDGVEQGNAYEKLADLYRNKKDFKQEEEVLKKFVLKSANSESSYQRLAEMSQKNGNWNKTKEYASRLLGVNPLSAYAYKTLGLACMKSGDATKAESYFEKALKCKESIYKSQVHFHLAEIFKGRDNKKAKRHVLMCLEDAPRFRDAYKLLRELDR